MLAQSPFRQTDEEDTMKTYRAMVVLCLLLAAVGMSMNPSSASEREDIFGQGTLTRVRIVVPPVVQVSDCGDTDPATFIRSATRTGTCATLPTHPLRGSIETPSRFKSRCISVLSFR